MNERYLTYHDLTERLGIAKSSVHRRIADGTLPKPIKIGKLSRFKESEINAALERLGQQRDQQ